MSGSANHESPKASHCGRLEGLLMRLSGKRQAIASGGAERIEAAGGASARSSMKPTLAAGSLVVLLALAASGIAYGSSEGDLRLVGGSSPSEGRVEIFFNGQWGTTCDDHWDRNDGDVACRQLGYPAGSERVFSRAHFGRGTGPIWLDNLRCSGSEARLLDCPRARVHNCYHAEDAGVRCNTDGSPSITVRPSEVTVMEEDTTGSSYEVVLDTQPSGTVTVTVSGTSGTAVTATPSTLTFTTANWDTAQRVTVKAGADANTQIETVTLTHRADGGGYGSVEIEEVSVTVRDDDERGVAVTPSQVTVMEEDATGSSYEVVLLGQPSETVTVSASVPGVGPAVITVTPLTLTFTTANWDTPQRVTVKAGADANMLNEGYGLMYFASGGGYDPGTGLVRVTVAVQDNDAHAVVVNPALVRVIEEDTTGSSYEAVLFTRPSDTVTVAVSGTSGTTVTATPSTLTFTTANWDTPQRVTVKAGADANAQNEEVTLTHRASGGGYDSDSDGPVTVVVRDNDLGVAVRPSEVTVREEDATGSNYEVVLRTQPSDTVTVTVSGTSGTAVTATPSTLTFTTANWDTAQIVRVTAGAGANEQNETVTLTHRASGGGYGSVPIEEVSVTVRDNDSSGAGNLRLVGGSSPSEGRVEIYHDGQWGTVCDDHWDRNDGDVACRQLGYPAGSEAVFGLAHFGWGSGPVWLDDLRCSGSEARLLDCPRHRQFDVHDYCTHSDDAGVRCDTSGVLSISIEPVAGETTELSMSWDAVTGAEKYRVKWKTGADAFNSGEETTDTSYAISGLTAGTTYTVEVTAIDTDTGSDVSLARNEANGTTHAALAVYHDADHSAGAVSRYDTAVGLLTAAGRAYTARNVTGTSEVDRLAGISNSVMPRFFLGDPEDPDWASEPGVNNGGLRWLRSVLAEPEEPPPPVPTVSIEGGAAVDEGTAASFTVTLSQAAPADGLTLAYSVSEDGAFVADADEGAKTVAVAAGDTSATLSVPTVDDGEDEADGTVTVALAAGAGYEVGDPSSASVTVRDDDDAAPLTAFTVYHDPAGPAGRYDTAVGLLTNAGRSYTARFVTDTAEVDRLAGVSNSVLPRFFLGDPEAAGWGPSEPGVNNGGLRWLRSQFAAQAQASSAPTVSVADASAQESSGAIAFAVTLSAASGEAVSVDWATSDGTAVAGTDYTAASGTLTFAPGETRKTVTVTLLDDVHDEGTETFTLVLSNPRPAGKATLADATATGSISNVDPLQRDWLARFGRAVASDAITAITARLQTPRDAGSHLTLGGHRFALDGAGAERPPAVGFGGASRPSWSGDPSGDRDRTMSGRELLLGTSFRAVLGSGAGVQWTGWGQGASVSQFSSAVPGLSLSGESATGAVGMDYERGRLLAGFAMTHSLGEGTAQGAGRSYAMGSAVTTMLPYARLALSERVSAWGLAGTGAGRLSLDLDGGGSERYGTGLSMTLAAAGVRGDLLTPDEASGFALALEADALWVRTESESVSAPGLGNLSGARADASRLRAVLDGSRTFALAGGRTLAPSVEFGLRHDGGDAETGTGLELGAGVGYADPSRGLDMALRVHGLAAHADDGYSEWSVSGSLRLEPGGSGRGLSLSLIPTWGNAANDAETLWSARDAGELGLAEDFEPEARLEGELGYGFSVGRMPGVVTPYAGFTVVGGESRAYRTGARWRIAPDAALGFEAARNEGAGGDGPEHRVGVEVQLGW